MWLIKDSCWMMGFRDLAVCVMVPTISVALFLCWKTRRHINRFLPNLAIFFWIDANALWMLDDFFEFDYTSFAILFFCLGLLTISFFYLRRVFSSR